MDTTRLIAAHEWVKNAELAINTDAGGGILDDETGKPLIYLVQGAEKTYATFDVIVTNPGGHSSRPRADNAIYQLAHALEKVEAYRFPVMSNELTRAYLGAVGQVQTGAVGEALRKFAADPTDAAAADELARCRRPPRAGRAGPPGRCRCVRSCAARRGVRASGRTSRSRSAARSGRARAAAG